MCTYVHCSNPPTEIDVSPQDTTAFLNMTGMFSCETSGGDFIVWRVNGTFFPNLPSDVRSDLDINPEGIVSGLSILTIPARAVYNGTTVQCVTGDIGGVVVESGNVTLTIQGIYYITYTTNMPHNLLIPRLWPSIKST